MIVMDAARGAMTHKRWPQFDVVKALGGITHVWCGLLWRLVRAPMAYLSCNPVTTEARDRLLPRKVHMVEVWRECWSEFGTPKVPLGSVHPNDAVTFVLDWLNKNKAPPKLVVHLLQPHAPYIGSVRLPIAAGNLMDGLTSKAHDVDILGALRDGVISWDVVRRAYRANLELVVPYALGLARTLRDMLNGPVIVTSDHGEALGETAGKDGPQWGHAGIPYGLIREVPWYVVE